MPESGRRRKKVLIYQFLKDNTSSERKILEHIPEVTLLKGPETMKFLFRMSLEEKEALKRTYADVLEKIGRKLQTGELSAEVIFLDEILYAIGREMVDEAVVCHLLEAGKDREWILTGRYEGGGSGGGDYISVLHKEKHPFDGGVAARKGIEY